MESASKASAVTAWTGQSRDFLVAVRAEMQKVTWPTRDELFKATRMIVILSVFLGCVIGLMDWVLNAILVNGVAAATR